MIQTRELILINCKEPITIKELQKKTNLKWANLSRHITRLKAKGFILDLGRDGKSKVIQLNKYKYKDHLESQREEIETLASMLK